MAEKKYIELQKALNVCEMHYQHCLEMHDWGGDATADNIMRDIETIPTADVVEVVRCKDCVYSSETVASCHYGVGRAIKPDYFCAYGERRKDDDV
jgi:hypothetical protein